jgi:RNA polymerase sigma-70 factor (ECF subfamily)
MDPEIERRLVERLKAGDEAAFDLIHEAYRHRLFAFLCRLTRNRDVAEDLLEETWVRLVSRIDTLRDETRLGGWLFAVARNLFLSHQRSRSYAAAPTEALDPVGDMVDPGPSPFDTTVARELDRRLERGLAALPASYREVLLLVGVHGMTPVEAAEVCDVRPDALRQRLLRARDLLARWLRSQNPAGQPAEIREDRCGRRRTR